MFDKKTKDAWHNIKAPDSLFEKIENSLEEKSPSNNRIKIGALSLIAASFLVVVMSFMFLKTPDAVQVYLEDGTQVTEKTALSPSDHAVSFAMARVVNTDVVSFNLDLLEETELTPTLGTVSVFSQDGTLICEGGSVKTSGNVRLEWTVPIQETACDVVLSATTDKDEYEIVLSLDPVTATRTLSCTKNKK